MNVIGHRGAAGLIDENTLESLQLAIQLGVDCVEFDVRRTADNMLVLHHDDSLLRITNDDFVIRNTRLSDIKRLRTKNGNTIIELSEALKLAGSTTVVIDVKDVGSSDMLLKTCRLFPKASVRISSFSLQELLAIQQLEPNAQLFYASYRQPLRDISIIRHHNFIGLTVNHRWLLANPLIYLRARKNGLKIITYPVNKLYSKFEQLLWCRLIMRLFDPNVVQLCTDYPNKVVLHKKI